MKCYAVLAFIGLHAAVVVVQIAGETRYECVLGMNGNKFGGRREMEENDEFEDFGETGGFGLWFGPMRIPALGSLSCPQGQRGNILLKRIKYGISMIPRTCLSNPFCSENFDNGKSFADSCDGRSSCSINWLQPQLLQCGRMSNYMLVEYECVDTWSTFEICETIHTVARGSSIILTSPGYIGMSKSGPGGQQKCECIIQSYDKADIYMDYLQTQLAGKDQQCPYEYVLLENKKTINQSGTDKELQVCGKHHLDGQWFNGAIRITYASGDFMQKRGLLTKFTVENIGNQPMIELDCGKINATDLHLLKRPQEPEQQQQPTFPDIPFMPFGLNGTGYLPQLPDMPFMPFGLNGTGYLPQLPDMPFMPFGLNGTGYLPQLPDMPFMPFGLNGTGYLPQLPDMPFMPFGLNGTGYLPQLPDMPFMPFGLNGTGYLPQLPDMPFMPFGLNGTGYLPQLPDMPFMPFGLNGTGYLPQLPDMPFMPFGLNGTGYLPQLPDMPFMPFGLNGTGYLPQLLDMPFMPFGLNGTGYLPQLPDMPFMPFGLNGTGYLPQLPDMPFMPFGFNGTGYLPQLPPMFKFPPPDFTAISPFAQYFAQWGINMGNQTETNTGSYSDITLPINSANKNVTTLASNMSAMPMPVLVHNNEQIMTHASNVKSVETEPAIHAQAKASAVKSEADNGKDKEHLSLNVDATDKGEMAVVIVACIGSVFILGSVVMYIIHRYRKRKRLRQSGAYLSRKPNVAESNYATVIEVENCRKGDIKHAHGSANFSSADNTVHRVYSSAKGVSGKKVSGDLAYKHQKKKNTYDIISSAIRKKDTFSKSTAERTVGRCEIAVIEAHHDMDIAENAIVDGWHEMDCLSACTSVAVKNDS